MRITFNPVKFLECCLLIAAAVYATNVYSTLQHQRVMLNIAKATVKVMPLHVRIDGSFGEVGHGSGVIVRKDGLIVTCAHVVSNTCLVNIETLSGTKVRAYVVGRDETNDTALLKLFYPLKGIRSVKVGKTPPIGLSVLCMGYPGPFARYVTCGVISNVANDLVYSDLVVAPGSSGGGVFSREGILVGLARGFTGPFPLPVYQGFTILTDITAARRLLQNYSY